MRLPPFSRRHLLIFPVPVGVGVGLAVGVRVAVGWAAGSRVNAALDGVAAVGVGVCVAAGR
jgi:hypothetical protein